MKDIKEFRGIYKEVEKMSNLKAKVMAWDEVLEVGVIIQPQ